MAWYRVDNVDLKETDGEQAVLSARECSAAAVCRNKVMITNGNDASTRFKDILEFDPRTLTVQKYASAQNVAQVPVSAHTFTSCDGRHFFQFGGWDGSRDIASMFAYDGELKTWSPVKASGEIPSARHFHTCVGLGSRIILYGGYDGSRWTNDLFSFDPATTTWKREKPPAGPSPSARASHHAVVLDATRMAIFAGFDGAEFLSDLWILHASTDDNATPPRISYRWERVDKKVKHEYWAESRSGGGMVAYKNHLIVYGGRCRREGKVSFSDRVEVFSLEEQRWREVKSTGAVPAPRKCFAYAHIKNKLFIFGGLGASTTYYRDIHCLDLDSVIEGEYGLDGAEPLRIPLPHSTFTADMHALVYEAFEEALGFGLLGSAASHQPPKPMPMASSGHAPAGGDFDATLGFRLAVLAEGHAYTEHDFQAYFAQANTPAASASADGAEPSSAAVGFGDMSAVAPATGETAQDTGPLGGENRGFGSPLAVSTAEGRNAQAQAPLARRDQPRLHKELSQFAPPGPSARELDHTNSSSALSDVTFEVEGARILLHKVILANRCEYFRVMFSSRWNDSHGTASVLRLEDVNLRTFWHLIHYIYTDMLPADFDVGEHALDLLEQAQKCDLVRLSFICQRELERFVADDTVCDILRQADMLNAMALRLSCMNFILENFERVTVQPAFIALPENVLREVLVRRSKRAIMSTRGGTPTFGLGGGTPPPISSSIMSPLSISGFRSSAGVLPRSASSGLPRSPPAPMTRNYSTPTRSSALSPVALDADAPIVAMRPLAAANTVVAASRAVAPPPLPSAAIEPQAGGEDTAARDSEEELEE